MYIKVYKYDGVTVLVHRKRYNNQLGLEIFNFEDMEYLQTLPGYFEMRNLMIKIFRKILG